MADDPNKRKAHVKRIFRIDENGDVDDSVSIDVLRLDTVPFRFRGLGDQRTELALKYKLLWNDNKNKPLDGIDASNADSQFENANAKRKTHKLKVKNPDNPDDTSQTVDLWLVDRMKVRMPLGGDTDVKGEIVGHVFNNKPPEEENASTTRKVSVIKVVNNDLGGFEMMDGDGVSKIVDWDDYKQKLTDGSKDDSNHLDVEVDNSFKVKFVLPATVGKAARPLNPLTGLGNTPVKYVLQNKQVENLFEKGDAKAVDANGDASVIRTDPWQVIVNVSADPQDFIVYGSVGATFSTTNPFIIYSKDGRKWTRLPTSKHPPMPFGQLVYGGGAWLAFGSTTNQVARSLNKFDTWQMVTSLSSTYSFDRACYGKPRKAPSNPPLDANGKPVNKGAFVTIGLDDNDDIQLFTSFDQGKTWTATKTISTGGQYAYDIEFLTFANGMFFACIFGLDDNNGGAGPTFGPAVPGSCMLYSSEDGETWDSGKSILSALCNTTWGSELQLPHGPFYMELHPKGLVYKKKSKTYVISGDMNGAVVQNLFYAESSSTSFGGSAIGSQALYQSPLGQFFDPVTGEIHNGGTQGDYYVVNVPFYRGGNIAAVGDATSIAAQKVTYTETTVTYTYLYFGNYAFITAGNLTVTSDQEGVLGPSFGQSYFAGGTISRTTAFNTDADGQPVPITLESEEARPAVMAASGRKQPNAGESSPGTFLWARVFNPDSWDPVNFGPVTNRGWEVRLSTDGSNYGIVSTPISGTVGGIDIAIGASPPESQT